MNIRDIVIIILIVLVFYLLFKDIFGKRKVELLNASDAGITMSSTGITFNKPIECKNDLLVSAGNINLNNGMINSLGFKVYQLYENMKNWKNIASANFTVGNGIKLLIVNYSCWVNGASNPITYFDFYNNSNTMILTLSTTLYFNIGSMHMFAGYTKVLSNTSLPAGTYYIKARSDANVDINDILTATLINFPVN